jgi:hypothetical protein
MNLRSLHIKPIRLIDGPLVDTRRAELVTRMANDLVAAGTAGDERDAIRTLFGKYAISDIMMLIDDARQAAAQEIVAREMGKP